MQITDSNGNVYGWDGLEINGPDGKAKVPVINTDITIGTTAIVGGAVNRILFQGIGNVVQESSSFTYDDTLKKFTLTGPIGSVIQHTALTNYNDFGGFQLNVAGGSERAFMKLQPNSGEFKIGVTGSGYFTTFHTSGLERARIFANGNFALNTTTDAGFKADINGTARVVNQFQVGSFTVGVAGASSSIVTTGRISAAGGITLYNPVAGDNQNTGIFNSGGVLIMHASSSVATFATVGGAANGTNVAINQGYNPGAGTGSVIGYSHSYALYPGANNTISYTSYYSRARWNAPADYNRITGPIRGFLFENSLYNTQKLIDVIAFQSNGGRLLFTGDLPAASVTSGISRGLYLNQTHTASANNDVLVGLDIAPTYTNGAFTGLTNVDLRTKGIGLVIGSGVGYGALYGYNNDGVLQVVDGGTSALSGYGYATQLWLRPSGNASGLNSNYWATIEQSTGGLFIQSGRYNSNIFIKTGRAGTSGNIYFNNAGGTMAMFFGATGNFTLNSITDAGYKADINGTVRIVNALTLGGVVLSLSSQGGGTISSANSAGNNTGPWINLNGPAYFNPATGNNGLLNLGGQYYVQSGNSNFNHLGLSPIINASGTYSGTIRGFYYNPTLTSITGVTHYAFHSTSGRIRFENLPTSSAGLSSGEIWNNSGVLQIV